MKKLLLIVALAVVAFFTLGENRLPHADNKRAEPQAVSSIRLEPSENPVSSIPRDRDDAILSKAFASRERNLQVSGQGKVASILPDDEDGSRHQRFILRLDSGQTLLVSHNIDLAPRIDSLQEGDAVAFYGEYEWNQKGGVIHWTHHDPQGRHAAGWLRHGGKTYQ